MKLPCCIQGSPPETFEFTQLLSLPCNFLKGSQKCMCMKWKCYTRVFKHQKELLPTVWSKSLNFMITSTTFCGQRMGRVITWKGNIVFFYILQPRFYVFLRFSNDLESGRCGRFGRKENMRGRTDMNHTETEFWGRSGCRSGLRNHPYGRTKF